MSEVPVTSMLMISSLTSWLRSNSAAISAWTRSFRCSGVSSSSVVAPLRARTGIGRAYRGLRGRPQVPWPSRRAAAGWAELVGVTGRHDPHGLLEGDDLGRGQRPPVPGAQVRVAQGPDAYPHEASHRMADGLAHPAHLTVAALVDGDAQQAGLGLADGGGRGRAVLELDALAQAPE